MVALRIRPVVVVRPHIVALALGIPGICALLVEPCLWLWRTWWDPTWDNHGVVAALAAAALLSASVRSGRPRAAPHAHAHAYAHATAHTKAHGPSSDDAASARDDGARTRERRQALALLATTAAIRLIGRLLDVRVLGASALAVDVAALALALGTARRPVSVSPAALGALFAFALPVEGVLQRLLGHPLRVLGAVVAAGIVHPFAPASHREGALLVDDGLRVFVDLPCSGAQGLVLLGGALAFLACVLAFSRRRVIVVLIATSAGAVLANGARIAALFLGARAGVDVWSEPLHSTIGILALALGALPLFLAARGVARRRPAVDHGARADGCAPAGMRAQGAAAAHAAAASAPRARCRSSRARTLRHAAPALFSAVAVAVALAPGHPVDVARAVAGPGLPADPAGAQSTAIRLSALEERYFAAWGGFVQKRRYVDARGVTDVVLVRTTSPLRHLHGPDRCLAGAGHDVERLGVVERAGVPSVLYRSTAPDGARFLVEATFVRDDGVFATSESEAAWRWLRAPRHAWMLLERIRTEGACTADDDCHRLDDALLAAVVDHTPKGPTP